MSDKSAAEVAALFGCRKRKVTNEATRNGIGYNLGGTAGYRFTEADVDALRQAMTPLVKPEERRTA
jgi:hypothetical protein